MKVRLQKFLADAGVASRRASEKIILAGEVTVNGRPVVELGSRVDPLHDEVEVSGKPVRLRKKLYIALNKPKGYICSREDPQGRKSVLDLLPAEWRHINTVGRLDFKTEGLLLLTNDGEFALHVTHPRYEISKTYRVVVDGLVERSQLEQMIKGVVHEGEHLRAEKARVLKQGPGQSLVEVILKEGKNREVRRLFETQGLAVAQLKRTQVGPVHLGELRVGRWRTLTESEIKSLLPDSSTVGAGSHSRRPGARRL